MTEIKKGPGRPKNPGVEREPTRPNWKMKAGANWEDVTEDDLEESPDRLRIPRSEIPEGIDLQWVTDSIFGQPMPERRASFEKRGWTPVHQEDFDGCLNGKFMPRGKEGEIKVDGMVLMARPLELSIKAKKRDRRAALEQVAVKEQALTGGDLSKVSLDSRHETALRSNKINKSYERIAIPEE